MRRRPAFTLLELLVTLAIIALLASLIFVALRGIRLAGTRTETSVSLRALAFAVTSYSTEHRQTLLPGSITAPEAERLRLIPRDPFGRTLQDSRDAETWVWRLMPYLDGDSSVVFSDYRSKAFSARITSALSSGIYGPGSGDGQEIQPSIMPAIGMNTTYVGGNDLHGPAALRAANPWSGTVAKIAATRDSEINKPSELVVFAPSRRHDRFELNGLVLGSPEIRPPRIIFAGGAVSGQWDVEGDSAEPVSGAFSGADGVPFVRWGRVDLPTARFDASVVSVELARLGSDMRLWLPSGAPD